LNEIGVHEFVKSLAETENEEDDDYCDTLNYESDLDNTNQNLPSQMGFKRALEAAAAKPEPDIDEEEEEDDVSVYIGMHFAFAMGIVSFAYRFISFIYHSIHTDYVTERRGVECCRRTT